MPKNTTKPAKKTTTKKTMTRKRAVSEKSVPVTSKTYTNMFDAYKAFWRRGFTDWRGTSSRSEYWWAVLANAIIGAVLVLGYVSVIRAINVGTIGGGLVFLFMLTSALIILYGVALIIPSVSMVLRRLHDTGLSSWWILLYFISMFGGSLPVWGAGVVSLAACLALFVFMLLPTKVEGNPYHKFNK